MLLNIIVVMLNIMNLGRKRRFSAVLLIQVLRLPLSATQAAQTFDPIPRSNRCRTAHGSLALLFDGRIRPRLKGMPTNTGLQTLRTDSGRTSAAGRDVFESVPGSHPMVARRTPEALFSNGNPTQRRSSMSVRCP